VTAIDADTATVHVGDAADLDVWALTGRAPVWTAGTAPPGPVECVVQVRAHGATAGGVAEPSGDRLLVQLLAPLRGVARGQTLVLYRPDPDGDEVIGSATIVGTS
jgi:tRNA-uridine 2-sulfurtransferase